MLSSGTPVSTDDVRRWREDERPFTISTGQIDLDFGIDLIPSKTVAKSKSCSSLIPYTQCFDKQSKTSTSQIRRDRVIVSQPLSYTIGQRTDTEPGQMPQHVQDTYRNNIRKASMADLAVSQYHHDSHYTEEPANHSSALLGNFFSSLSVASSISLSELCQTLEDDLIIIDGQIVVRDSNVDPILCRLRRQQVVAGTKKKESSVATDMLEAERVRFDRHIEVKRFDESGSMVRKCVCFFCCCCKKKPFTKQFSPRGSILINKKQSPKGKSKRRWKRKSSEV